MIIVRPIKKNDLPALHKIAVDSGHGFTSLPVNDALLVAQTLDSLDFNVILDTNLNITE
jgi:arginine/ornithine N-succinyltransferase beta subunit